MRLVLRNPFYKQNKFKNLFWWHVHLFGHKYFEFEILRDNYYWVESEFEWTTKKDHAGTKLIFGIFGYSLCWTIYDSRHWVDVLKN
jgi:hypothetical protein